MSTGSAPSATRRPLEFILTELITAGIGLLSVWLSAKMLKRLFDPGYASRAAQTGRVQEIVKRLQRTGVHPMNLLHLSCAEQSLLFNLVFPEDIDVGFGDVGGLAHEKQALREIVVLPLTHPHIFGKGRLLSPPKGILLYGPPGTGKTMLAKALAKESGANFLAISPSSLFSKYLGETEALVSAVFSLARRVSPTVIFIDEIDSLFSTRSTSEHEVHRNLKSEFMQLWDGLLTSSKSHVIVLGATNRPYDIDPAIARRMPRSFEVALPNCEERVQILEKMLSGENIDPHFDYMKIARVTEGYSGSDLKELCRTAMMTPVKEAIACESKIGEINEVRCLKERDVLASLGESGRTEVKSREYGDRVAADDPLVKIMSALAKN